MHPILLELPFDLFGRHAAIHSYGFMVGMGFVTALFVTIFFGKRAGIEPDRIINLSLILLLSGLAGGRLLFIIVNIRDYLEDPRMFSRFWEGGLVWYGALAGAAGAGLVYMRIRKMPFWETSDVLMPGVAIGHAIGRLGCFMAGCCWGTPCSPDFIFGARFVDGEALAPKNIPLHPVQLYEAGGEMVVFTVLVAISLRKRFDGQLVLVYAMLYPILRSITEMYRGDIERGYLIRGLLSTSQFISITVFLAASGFLAYRLIAGKKGER